MIMYNNNWLYIINDKKKGSFFYENKDFSFELISSHIHNKNSLNNTFNQPNYHFHSYYELQMILEGCSSYEIENIKSFDVKNGNFVIFPPKTKHKITKETAPFSKFVITFKFSYKNRTNSQFHKKLEEKLKNYDALPYSRHIHSIFQSIYQISQKNNFNYEISCFFLEISMIIELFNVIMEKEISNLNISYDDTRINKAIEYIKNNLNSPLKVSDVAEYLNLSTRQFTKIFTEQTGTSPGRYIHNYKIKYSTDLLINSELSISEIANILEFPDSSTFIKAFKKSKGITPSKYRKTHKEF